MCAPALWAQRSHTLLTQWNFCRDSICQPVIVPHDWAIYGPFDRRNDLQTVAVEQNGEHEATQKTGRTGGLPFIGKGVYTTSFFVADTASRTVTLIFDGVMSNARVSVNDRPLISWPYGYNSFYAVADSLVMPGENRLTVECENLPEQSRWYPGAGIYRNVHLIDTHRVHVPVWGHYAETPFVTDSLSTVTVHTDITGASHRQMIDVDTRIFNPQGNVVGEHSGEYCARGQSYSQSFAIDRPQLWSPDSPALYKAMTVLKSAGGDTLDVVETSFGIRLLQLVAHRGMLLNGKPIKFKGVCNHHDLGPLGAAVNRSALAHQLSLLKQMGANAIRTSHNMPAPELAELCDEMGMMLMVEPFDDWGFRPKSANGYGRIFDQWADRDIENMVRQFRRHPSVVMWSIGNEVPSQWGEPGIDELQRLCGAVRRLDSTRPITCGMDQVGPGAVIDNGFAAALDIAGFNYKPQRYPEFYRRLPQGLILGTETASTVSSRGKYYFPVTFSEHNVVLHPENQSNGYDNESCPWSNTPDIDFARDEDFPWVIGQFVWTGFDYLGEPSPYDTDAWPSHSSLFGIFDLAWLPKDRYYLYRSVWNETAPTLHILPHWTWPGRVGETIPVFVYTSYPKAELFVNGKSLGIKEKNNSTLQDRYRLMWPDVIYEPGELKVVAYDDNGSAQMSETVRTASDAARIVAEAVSNPDADLVYYTVRAVDPDGTVVPTAEFMIDIEVTGGGKFKAAANGDPTCLLPFHQPRMKLFSGQCTVIVERTSSDPINIRLSTDAF